MQASEDGRSEDMGPGLDDYEPVPDDNPEAAAAAAGSQGFSDDGVTEQGEEEEEGEDLFGDNYIRCVLQGLCVTCLCT